MRELFYPEGVVVIGVSDSEDNLGKNILINLLELGYKGDVYAVGPREGEIFNKKIYKSVQDIPSDVDLAVIIIPAERIPAIIEECGKKGIKWGVILSAGFRELSQNRIELENRIIEISNKYGFHFIGPNCQGIFNTDNNLFLPFSPLRKGSVSKGPATIIAQSSTVGFMISFILTNEGIGVNKLINIGNKLNIDEIDLLPYFLEEEETGFICLHLESIERGKDLMDLAMRSKKPFIVYKTNIVKESSEIAMSHTAALASDKRVVDAALKQAGTISINGLTKFASTIKALSLPPMKGDNLVIMSSSGGYAIIASDLAGIHGFRLPPIPDALLEKLKKYRRYEMVRLSNPMDLADIVFDSRGVLFALQEILSLDEVDGIVFSLFHLPHKEFMGSQMLDLIKDIKKLSNKADKPIAISFISEVKDLISLRDKSDYPVFYTIAEAVNALSVSREYWRYKNRAKKPLLYIDVDEEKVKGLIYKMKQGNGNGLELMEILKIYGIPVEIPGIARDLSQAIKYAEEIGYPVVMKIFSKRISHKSDMGGVILDIKDRKGIEDAYNRIKVIGDIEGVQIQKMIKEGKEVILGIKYDAQFGHIIMFGFGGIYVELFEDVSFRVLPITEDDARDMIEEVKSSRILKGIRGDKPSDIEFIINSLLKLSQLAIDFPEIKELDINPLKVFGEGGTVVDARIVL
jgi:acetyltransferase